MKRLLMLISLMTLTAFAADPQAAARRAQEEYARKIAGEINEALPVYGRYELINGKRTLVPAPRTGSRLAPTRAPIFERPRSATR